MAPGDPCPRCGGPTTGVVLAWKRPAEQRLACVGIGGGHSCGWSGAEAMGMPRLSVQDEPILAEEVGIRVKRRREWRGWTQWHLAELAGLEGPSMVCRIENGNRLPSVAMLARLAEALGCRIADLVP